MSMRADAGQNYFELFSLPESFRVDHGVLDREYRKLQSRYHPDKAVKAGERERRVAVQMAGLVNEAYETLRSPLRRAGYLLALRGVDTEENVQGELGPDFLLRQMELREELEAIEGSESLQALDRFKQGVEKDINAFLREFQSRYEAGAFEAARAAYYRLQFLYKLCTEIDRTEEKLLDY